MRLSILSGLGLTRSCKQSLAGIRQDHYLSISVAAAVLRAKSFHRNHISDLQRVSAPASPGEQIGTSHFHSPVPYVAAIVLHVDVEPGVRILPLQLRDCARQLDRQLCVKDSGEGVVRGGRLCGEGGESDQYYRKYLFARTI